MRTPHYVGRTVSGADVSSDEELSRLIGDDPLFFYSRREIYPLTTRETHKKYLKELLKH